MLTSITLNGCQALGDPVLFLVAIANVVPYFSCVAMERLKAKSLKACSKNIINGFARVSFLFLRKVGDL